MGTSKEKDNKQLLTEIDNLKSEILRLKQKSPEGKKEQTDFIEEKFKAQQYLDIAEVMLVSIDTDGVVQMINPKGCEILGYSVNEIIGRNWFDLAIPVSQREMVKEVAKKVISGDMESVKYFENNILTKSGEERLMAFHNSDIRDKNGKIILTLSSGEDITDRKRAENELAKLQVLHNETEKTAKIGGWTFDIETMEQTWTDGIFRILEIDLSMGAPKVPEGIAFIDPPYRQIAELAIQKSIENGEPYDQEWIVTTSKGNKRWVQSIANPHVENGKTIKISGSFQDITDRKQVEEALYKSEQRFKMLVTNIEEIIYLVDKNGIFTVSEGKGLEKLGLKPGQVVGMSVFDFYKDYPDILKGIKKALNGETNGIEVQIGPNYFTNWSTPHFNPEGEVIGLIGLAINITDRKKAENELKKHHEHLEELVKERTKDLETKNKELDNAMKVFVGRELAIRNLQDRIRALEGK